MPMGKHFDFIVIGAGIAGASAAALLAEYGSVLLVEGEERPGYHTTGRSAAFFMEGYGGDAFRALTRASRAFLDNPPDGFTRTPLLHGTAGCLFVAGPGQIDRLKAQSAGLDAVGTRHTLVSGADVREFCPVMRPERVVAGLWEPDDREIDVAALHQGYLALLRRRGGTLAINARVQEIRGRGGAWTVVTRAATFHGGMLVNAADAWGDHVAGLARLRPVGLMPLRRTAITFPAPAGLDTARWPVVIDVDETYYFKPGAGQILASPANEDPMPACDVQPEEMDIALCVDRIETETQMRVPSITARWAGLRTFAPDRAPVIGPDPDEPGFLWLCGQGGQGIQSSPGMARLLAEMAIGGGIPADMAASGLRAEMVSPARLRG